MKVDPDLINGKIPAVFRGAKTLSQFYTITTSSKNWAVYCWMPPATTWQRISRELHRVYYHNEQGFSLTNPEVLCWSGTIVPKSAGEEGENQREETDTLSPSRQSSSQGKDGYCVPPSHTAATLPTAYLIQHSTIPLVHCLAKCIQRTSICNTYGLFHHFLQGHWKGIWTFRRICL